jgi:hypothetical protein
MFNEMILIYKSKAAITPQQQVKKRVSTKKFKRKEDISIYPVKASPTKSTITPFLPRCSPQFIRKCTTPTNRN